MSFKFVFALVVGAWALISLIIYTVASYTNLF